MPDNVQFQATVATPPNTTLVRTKDRSGVETQVVGLDANPGGTTEQLLTSPDANLPARIKDLDISIRDLIVAITQTVRRDSFGRERVMLSGGYAAISAGTLDTLTTLTTITNPVNHSFAGGSLPFGLFQVLSDQAWANVRARIN